MREALLLQLQLLGEGGKSSTKRRGVRETVLGQAAREQQTARAEQRATWSPPRLLALIRGASCMFLRGARSADMRGGWCTFVQRAFVAVVRGSC
eukprot:280903-Chlamydomonas_euryale.AAC.3